MTLYFWTSVLRGLFFQDGLEMRILLLRQPVCLILHRVYKLPCAAVGYIILRFEILEIIKILEVITCAISIGYPNFGSDIGGYRSGDGTLGRTKELFIRWAQLGAFSPLMENGGNKEHRPWAFDSETLEIYKKSDIGS